MLISLKSFRGYGVYALDGFAGLIHEFIFDEKARKIHGIVVNTGIFLMPDLHLIKPESVTKMDFTEGRFSVNITKKEILLSPKVSVVKKNKNFVPVIWGGTYFLYGWYQIPEYFSYTSNNMNDDSSPLRSNRELKNYKIQTFDSDKGSFGDFLLDIDSLGVKYLIINLNNNLISGKKVLVDSEKVNEFERANSTIYLNMTFDELKNSAAYYPNEFGIKDQLNKHKTKNRNTAWLKLIGNN